MQGMIERLAKQQLTSLLKLFPAVAILGPRQCGKTTIAKSLGGVYYDLEKERERFRLDVEWDSVVAGKGLITFDEAQNWPELFTRLRSAIDEDRSRHGRFLLLGSVSPALTVNVSESLAGRLARLELTPLLGAEVGVRSLDEIWLVGGFPGGGILNAEDYPLWQENYIAHIVERDLPLWGLTSNPATTSRLLRMLAAFHGQNWNASQVGQSMGMNHKEVNRYLDYLVGAFLLRRLEPYYANIGKRLIKSPKLYWRDTGLLHSLLNVPNLRTLLDQPWVGASWEGFVIEQAISTLQATGKHFNPYFFRTSDQYEIDLVLDFGSELWAIECKLAASPSIADMERLHRTADLIKAKRRIFVCKSGELISNGDTTSCDLDAFLKILLK
jgi:predicted AAA+ superfamily ATPase